jgi:hypothetical protein
MSSLVTVTVDDDDEQLLARDMIDAHGASAASVARDNVRAAALGGQRPQARHWLRVLGMIQHIQTGLLATTPMEKGFPFEPFSTQNGCALSTARYAAPGDGGRRSRR